MTGIGKRRVHSAEFKAKVGMEAIRSVKMLNEIGSSMGYTRCGQPVEESHSGTGGRDVSTLFEPLI